MQTVWQAVRKIAEFLHAEYILSNTVFFEPVEVPPGAVAGGIVQCCATGAIDREVLCVALCISNGGFRLPVPGDANASEAEVLLLTRPCLFEVPTGAIG
jgi:hypothetical protein